MNDANNIKNKQPDLEQLMIGIGVKAKKASKILQKANSNTKNEALNFAAEHMKNNIDELLHDNEKDLNFAKSKNLSFSLIDRMTLDKERIFKIISSLQDIIKLPDPVGKIIDSKTMPNKLMIQRAQVPIGVIGIIYESRPNVTADASALCLKSGNAAILRSGSESFFSSQAIMRSLTHGFIKVGLPKESIQLIPTIDRKAVGTLLNMNQYIDILVPRGGNSLIEKVMNNTTIPVIAHLTGNCHTYIHKDADPKVAEKIIQNAKMRRTSICGATESLLIDIDILNSHLPLIVNSLLKKGCIIYGDKQIQDIDSRILPATMDDWSTEYLDAKISIKTVKNIEGAIDHIENFGSHHTDAIITTNLSAANLFLNQVDSAIVMHNTSTQFADGGEFGLGAEIGISTGRLHARGPVGLNQLVTYKWIVHGNGQIRK